MARRVLWVVEWSIPGAKAWVPCGENWPTRAIGRMKLSESRRQTYSGPFCYLYRLAKYEAVKTSEELRREYSR